MGKQQKSSARSQPRPGSLLAPEAMGGINAGKGFDFQNRFAACHIPVWLLEADFFQLFHEGTGDIDVRYQGDGESRRIHIQVKDHEVAPAEFKNTLAHFRTLNSDLTKVYKGFRLVCPSLSAKLRPIERALARYRNAKPFYDDAAAALAQTKDELDERLRKIGLDDGEIDFIHACVAFEIGHGDLRHDERALETFAARLLKHPEYANKPLAAVQQAFAQLLRALQDRRGQVIGRHEIDQILRAAVATSPAEKKVTLWVQNWTRETFDVPANYAIDWSQHFDRGTRRVPAPETWNKHLLPELKTLREKIQGDRAERLIRFRGKCALSTGIALGAAFPAVGGWTFEIPQPPAKEPWRSDASATSLTELKLDLIDSDGTDLVLGLNIRGDGREDIRSYVSGAGGSAKLFAFMGPKTPGNQAIAGAEEAGAFARAVREQLGRLLKSQRIKRTRLFFYGPFALAVFLGQQLTSTGEIQLFEYQDPGYVPSCTLRT